MKSDEAIEFARGLDQGGLEEDLKSQSAILHQLMVLGEAVKRLSAPFRSRHSRVPWTLIAGMRDRLIHGYDIVDLDEVWKTATVDVPVLLDQFAGMLPRGVDDTSLSST
jgi:uncharacterized protein with HEPN domain